MEVIPAIDLRDGCCVRLTQGDYARETVFSDDPVEMARRWAGEGATRIHVVDLDGARDGRPINNDVVRRIIDAVEPPVQVAGGVRTLDAIQTWLDTGADRVILGTAAVRDPEMAAEAARRHGDRIVVSIDARGGVVAVEGWREETQLQAKSFLQKLASLGVPRFVYTDINRDAMLDSPNYEMIETMVGATERPLIAAGGVADVEHLTRLSKLGVEGAIVGLALYDGRLDLREAIAAVR
ncbi:MAG: 1-(5-phosphoribosyl)-5-[(5-phosphoribosylamino)methylideneamino]imidazole-4-carboxamide isomerase [Chloroflexi bacterium]|nr:1-(5-phosphoribosyl)-5-[(5-phosphoribosylamino)methylideneamino]imidazole-4-carboxamide isomerase [Chloroflexota bacterium]MCI0855245.1 1-(5-phosphoribosyl)-5-[(5-phosphoribosylamino)methylideneamino]imidazole-4-carboxamide isomerase [Chloroflexota bacterium]MCI0889717.1 1-(5-phosphoribosyl)-5-[(5-phosphoribosylamino)methylideneamino]imidazole-4-carboxamide isomerase [Chloroflexota bacterium]